ncbi:helix-turn-helix transcriptional regulator [Rhodanobacter glycinis]|nr:LuxR C-terminal-related transcriptional regulator [Rhodanobacter glycinis]
MDRWNAKHLLDALYGMDFQTPDWTPFFAGLSEAFHSHVIAIQTHDTMHRLGRMMKVVGVSDTLLARYEALSHDHLWFERGATPLLSNGLADDRGLATEAELKATRFYAEFMAPARVVHGMALCLYHQGPNNLAVLTVNRDSHSGYYNEHEHELARKLLPHLRNVYALQQRLGWLEDHSQRFRSALNLLTDGVLLLDADGHLLFCNNAAQQMEVHQLFARRPDGRLAMPWPADEHLLLHGKLTGMLKFCPAGLIAGTQWSEFQVRVIAFIKIIAPAISTAWPRLQDQWGFTPAEAQLAQWLMQGFSLDEAAERIGVTKNTVRTQLRSLFDKTETRRQADLMRVLIQLSHV